MPDILSQIRQGRRVEHYETRRRRKDGEIIDVALTVSPVRDASGRIVGASKIARDITDRRRAEEERAVLLAREKEARRTAELLNRVGPRLAAQLDPEKLVQEVTDLATALVGAEFGVFFHNATNAKDESYTLYALSGVPREALAGFAVPANRDLFGPTFRGEGSVRCDDMTLDPRYGENAPRYDMPAGHLPLRSYLAAPVIARSSELLGGLFFGHSEPAKFTEAHESIIRGIAAQAAIAMDNARLFEQDQWIQKELKRSNEDLRRANRDLEAFAYSASHDLQEPLRNIAISAQLMERNWTGSQQDDNALFLANILKASDRMKALIDDLLAYTLAMKHEAGPAPPVDSGRVLADVLAAMRASIGEAGATVTAGQLPVVAIHETCLSRLFQNLISNAIKYRSKEPPHVRVRADERDGWFVFSVADNGIGIEAQYAEQIFAIFKRLHGSDEYPGSGIGLAICQRVLEQYGGRIWLEQSEPGRGSTFCFAIPLRSR
jgi:signal transduction histidine kinase